MAEGDPLVGFFTGTASKRLRKEPLRILRGFRRRAARLFVRQARASKAAATAFSGQLRVACPAHPDGAFAAPTSSVPWAGAAFVCARVDGTRAHLVTGSRC